MNKLTISEKERILREYIKMYPGLASEIIGSEMSYMDDNKKRLFIQMLENEIFIQKDY